MVSGVQVKGLNRLTRDLQRFGVDVEDLKDGFARIAAEAADRISALAPRRSGRLAGDVRGNRAKAKAVVRVGRSSVPYAAPTNYGWPRRNIRPDLFVQRGEADYLPQATRRLEEEITDAARKRNLL